MKSILLSLLSILAVALPAAAEFFSPEQCEGTRMPYPAPDSIVATPDSLVPVMIYHVGRHGARYATSPEHFLRVEAALQAHEADLTAKGKRLLEITSRAIEASEGHWGDLDSLGIAEQQGIAKRMCNAYPQLIVGQHVTAISSYVGRCVESMDAFAAVLRRLQSGIGEVSTSSGRQYSPLMRPFAVDSAYVRWAKEKPYAKTLNLFTVQTSPGTEMLNDFMTPMAAQSYSPKDAMDLDASIYYVITSLGAMGRHEPDILSLDDMNALWQIDNLRQYLSRTQTTISSLPAEIATPLLQNMIESIDAFILGDCTDAVQLHFGHAETLMPLLSLMRLPGCYYLTHYFDTVAAHWQTFNVVPMAANLQIIVFRNRQAEPYVRIDLNERPLQIQGQTYISWLKLREYLFKFI